MDVECLCNLVHTERVCRKSDYWSIQTNMQNQIVAWVFLRQRTYLVIHSVTSLAFSVGQHRRKAGFECRLWPRQCCVVFDYHSVLQKKVRFKFMFFTDLGFFEANRQFLQENLQSSIVWQKNLGSWSGTGSPFPFAMKRKIRNFGGISWHFWKVEMKRFGQTLPVLLFQVHR